MDCSNCGAPLPAKSNVCRYCETLNDTNLRTVRSRRTAGESRGACPHCKKALETTAIALEPKIDVDRCACCHGIFFDPGELEQLLEASSGKIRWVDRDRLDALVREETHAEDFKSIQYVKCPDCSQLMNRKAYGAMAGVVTDQCRQHGIWLDGGELHRLLKWRAAGGKVHDAEAKAQRKLDEAKRLKQKAVFQSSRLGGTGDLDRGSGISFDSDRSDGVGLIEVLVGLGRLFD